MEGKPQEGASSSVPPHYLGTGRKVGRPAVQVALSVIANRSPAYDDPYTRPLRLACWHAIAWGPKARQSGAPKEARGCLAAQFWDWLAALMPSNQQVWIWQVGACEGLTQLGFWKRLEEKWVTLSGNDPSSQGQRGGVSGAGASSLLVISDPPTIIRARLTGKTGSLLFTDARNLGVECWSEMFRDCGLPTSSAVPRSELPADLGACACDRAQALKQWLMEWQDTCRELGLGEPRYTAAAQAWHGWRQSYMREGILIHGNTAVSGLERASYFSGRCEAFRLGRVGGPVYQLDSSAHYPAVAARALLPARLLDLRPGGMDDYEMHRGKGWIGIARCQIRTEIPIAPYQYRGIAVYPVGEFSATLCGPEIDHAIDRGAVRQILETAWYHPGELFTQWVDTLYRARGTFRAQGRGAAESCVKRMMNSLFGKFAQRGTEWRQREYLGPVDQFMLWYGLDPETGEPCRWRSIAGVRQYEAQAGEHPDSLTAVAAWINSLGRVKLLQWIEIAGWENVYYVDTDSLFCNAEGYERLDNRGCISPGILGSLRLVEIHPWLEVCGYKHYRTESRLVCSGVPRWAEWADEGGYRFWSPERLIDSTRRGRAPEAVERLFVRRAGHGYRHGIVRSDGTVDPHRFSQKGD